MVVVGMVEGREGGEVSGVLELMSHITLYYKPTFIQLYILQFTRDRLVCGD